jgi:hypothetical protein
MTNGAIIVILTSGNDSNSIRLAHRWAPTPVGLLTPQDLSVAGWRHSISSSVDGVAVVGGVLVPEKDVAAVFTRLHCISPEDLIQIEADDRAYAAAEMTAFLLFWLSQLKCPVLNRPTPASLSGPYWRQEQWVYHASQLGIPVRPIIRRAIRSVSGQREQASTPIPSATVTVVGNRLFGNTHATLKHQARRLANLAGVNLLAVHFSGPDPGAKFVTADTFPSLAEDEHSHAVLDYLRGLSSVGEGK